MKRRNLIRACLTVVCTVLAMGAATAPAQAAVDPIYVFSAPKTGANAVPPGTGFNGLCGFAVDISGNLYVSDYYHHAVDVFNSTLVFQKQLANVDPLDGPCGLAIDSGGRLYVNSFHRSVVRYSLSPFPLVFSSTFSSGTVIDSQEPTGVAVQQGTSRVFVDDRDHISVYDTSGALLEEIGAGSLLDGYGVAVVGGKVYVADAGTDTVKVYEPAVSTTAPTATVSGPPGGFDSLVDSALAVDTLNGDLYVADRVGSRLTEHPEAVIDVFAAAGGYKGHLKYNVVDGPPVGLAVDNSTGNQGRVYVTSGNGEGASFYAYTPNAATFSSSQPAVFSLSVISGGAGAGAVVSQADGIDCASNCEAELSAGSELSLTAAPAAGSAFAGWSGAGCAGGGECVLTMDQAKAVSAEFVPLEDSLPTPAPASGVSPAAAAPASAAATRRRRHRAEHRHHRRHAQGRHGRGRR